MSSCQTIENYLQHSKVWLRFVELFAPNEIQSIKCFLPRTSIDFLHFVTKAIWRITHSHNYPFHRIPYEILSNIRSPLSIPILFNYIPFHLCIRNSEYYKSCSWILLAFYHYLKIVGQFRNDHFNKKKIESKHCFASCLLNRRSWLPNTSPLSPPLGLNRPFFAPLSSLNLTIKRTKRSSVLSLISHSII